MEVGFYFGLHYGGWTSTIQHGSCVDKSELSDCSCRKSTETTGAHYRITEIGEQSTGLGVSGETES